MRIAERGSRYIAAICATPARGTPRKWPVSCLKIKGQEVILWDVKIGEPCFALALRLLSIRKLFANLGG